MAVGAVLHTWSGSSSRCQHAVVQLMQHAGQNVKRSRGITFCRQQFTNRIQDALLYHQLWICQIDTQNNSLRKRKADFQRKGVHRFLSKNFFLSFFSVETNFFWPHETDCAVNSTQHVGGKICFKKQAYPGEAIGKRILWGGSLGCFPCTVPAISSPLVGCTGHENMHG